MESRVAALHGELDEERKKQLGLVKVVHEREHEREMKEMKDHHIWEREAQREQLDSKHQELFDQMKAKMEESYAQQLEMARKQTQVLIIFIFVCFSWILNFTFYIIILIIS